MQDVVTLGTDAGCDVRFDPAWDKTASPRHATLRRDGRGGWKLEDTSRDGCWIDGRRLPARYSVEPGETVLEIGKGGPRIKLVYAAPEPAAIVPTVTAINTAPAPVHPQAAPVYAPAAQPRRETPAVQPPRTLVPEPSAAPPIPNRVWIIAAAALVLLVVAGWFLLGPRAPIAPPSVATAPASSGNADEKLAAVAQQYEDAIGLVVNSGFTRPDGATVLPDPQATAWAIGEKVFATNSHVTEPAAEELSKGRNVFIVINHHPDRKYRVVRAVVHPKFGQPLVNFDGRTSAVPGYDVGLLYVDAPVPNRLPVAPESELKKLASGYRVGYLGFPMENLAGDGVDFRNPVAIMQSGILTSVTDYWLSKADFSSAKLLEHNLASTGGASGSPIFNTRGEVVGIHCAGNHVYKYNQQTKRVERSPSAVLINFAQRVDVLRDIYPEYGK